MIFDSANKYFQLAVKFVDQTNRNIFLTGKAGTGKTTFLRYICSHSSKKTVIVAPTGVAAINAGGVTIHSFFQLPFAPFIPAGKQGWNNQQSVNAHSLLSNLRVTAVRRKLFREMELLVIDEVSMVRADVLDAIDIVLRHFRKQPLLPFGGVQVLLIGDLYQLPPVAGNEWELLQQYYNSPFFFDAQVVAQAPPVFIELKKIYRQTDLAFINILNNIRNNCTTHEDLQELRRYYRPGFRPAKDDKYITLTTHNAKADVINNSELAKLPGHLYSFEANVSGEFNEKSFPAEKVLSLKEGAQIMFIKNDKGEVRRYFNGKIGLIKKIEEENITISFSNGEPDIVIEKETWKNIRYNYNDEDDKIEEEELGVFEQFPIRLAWAITIHKSQGLTFDKAVIDAGASFAAGQVYVALSRLTSLDGLVLLSPVDPSCIRTDERVMLFCENELNEDDLAEMLAEGQKEFLIRELMQSFDWNKLVELCRDHYEMLKLKQIPQKADAIVATTTILNKLVQQQEVALKFAKQMDGLLAEADKDGFSSLQQRVISAVNYFTKVINDELIAPLEAHIKEVKKLKRVTKYRSSLGELQLAFQRKKAGISHAEKIVEGFTKGMEAGQIFELMAQTPAVNELPKEDKSTTKPAKGASQRQSLEMFKNGKSIKDIAEERNLAFSTIEGHLAEFILTGDITIEELVKKQRIEAIQEAMSSTEQHSASAIREKLGGNYSYGEIKAVFNHFLFEKERTGKEATNKT